LSNCSSDNKALPAIKCIPAFPLIHREPTNKVKLLSRFSRDVGTHVPRVGVGEQSLVVELGDEFVPTGLCFFGGFYGLFACLLQCGDGVDDPVALDFDAGGAVAEGCGSLGSV
jgi:hypothetical protein